MEVIYNRSIIVSFGENIITNDEIYVQCYEPEQK